MTTTQTRRPVVRPWKTSTYVYVYVYEESRDVCYVYSMCTVRVVCMHGLCSVTDFFVIQSRSLLPHPLLTCIPTICSVRSINQSSPHIFTALRIVFWHIDIPSDPPRTVPHRTLIDIIGIIGIIATLSSSQSRPKSGSRGSKQAAGAQAQSNHAKTLIISHKKNP